MTISWTKLLDVVVSVAALAILAIVVTGSIRGPGGEMGVRMVPADSAPDSVASERMLLWNRLITGAHAKGPADAKVQIVVFGSYRCSFCIDFMAELETVRAKYPEQLRIHYRHNEGRPDPANVGYRLALAAECAADEGKFNEFSAGAYRSRAPYARNPVLVAIAKEAGVADTTALLQCVEERRHAPRLAAADSLVNQLGLTSTPFWYMNGVPYKGAPNEGQLEGMILKALNRAQERDAALNRFQKRVPSQ
jgi:predicted DsbA family dithiol-disulfide isomerase